MASNTESGSGSKEQPRSQETVRGNEYPKKRRSLSDDTASDLIEEDKKVPPVEYKESSVDSWISDNAYWKNFENISWQNGEFLKSFVNEMLLTWSQDKNRLEEVKQAFKMEDFSGGEGELFVSMHIDGDRYYFDFNFVRNDGTSRKYSLNFVRREDLVEAGGDISFYLEEIAKKEETYSKRKKKPWHVSGDV